MSDLAPILPSGVSLAAPVMLTLRVAGLATFFSFFAGVGAAWFVARGPFRGRGIIDAHYLILLVGRRGLMGPWRAEAGINLMFSWQGAVVAATVVVFPLIYKAARAALESVDHSLERAARTLGASEWKVFVRVSLPLAWRGIFAGTMLAFARGMGEFGATLMLAGNLPGRTQTLALAIYDAFQSGNDAQATLLVAVTSVLCMSVLLLAERLAHCGRRMWS